jgi:zinc transport system ATP-binding protein
LEVMRGSHRTAVAALSVLFLGATLEAHLHRAFVHHGFCTEHGVSIHLTHAAPPTTWPGSAAVERVPAPARGAHDCAELRFLAQDAEREVASAAIAGITTSAARAQLGTSTPVGGELVSKVSPLPVGYIPQRSVLDPLVPLRSWDVVAMGVERGSSFLRPLRRREARGEVDRALSEMGAAELAPRSFGELSEGQKQRVLMARLVAGHPALAVLDEPTAAMDEVAERQTLELIDQLRKDHGMAVLIVSHHLPVVSRFADQVLFLDRDAQAAVAGPPEVVFRHPAFRARYGDEGPLPDRAGPRAAE